MAEILLDTKFWNKVFKILKPSTVVAVKKNKGAGKNQSIPSTGSANLNRKDNEPGFFYKFMSKHCGEKIYIYFFGGTRLDQIKTHSWDHGLTEARVKEIEKAIVQVSVAESQLPESVLYDGKPVINATKLTDRSTIGFGFGFVYFVRNDEIYKVGITDNLLRRIKELKPDEILNSVRYNNYQEIEKSMHAHFKNRRIPHTEYFRLDAAEVE